MKRSERTPGWNAVCRAACCLGRVSRGDENEHERRLFYKPELLGLNPPPPLTEPSLKNIRASVSSHRRLRAQLTVSTWNGCWEDRVCVHTKHLGGSRAQVPPTCLSCDHSFLIHAAAPVPHTLTPYSSSRIRRRVSMGMVFKYLSLRLPGKTPVDMSP